jgi:IS605 OrfB family transposase
MSYQIINPVETDWKTFDSILKQIQKETRIICNRTINLLMDFENKKEDIKSQTGVYPKVQEVYNCSQSSINGYIYDKVKQYSPTMYSANISSTMREAISVFNTKKQEIKRGDSSVPSFRNDLPIYLHNNCIEIEKIENKYFVTFSLLSSNKEIKQKYNQSNGQIKTQLKSDDKTQKTIIDRCLSGEYKIGGSQILKKKNKWILNLCYGFEVKGNNLDKDKIMGVDLGVAVPAYMAFNFDNYLRDYIKDNRIVQHKIRLDKELSYAKSQKRFAGKGSCNHGRKIRLDVYNKYSNKSHNLSETINHSWSKYIVELAFKNGCGTIQMEDLSGFNNNKEDRFLSNWTYYSLQQKIKYKAEEKGIQVIKIDPHYTSQRCSKCGCIHEDNRPKKPNQSKFKCIECGYEANADFNAARNISTKDIDIIIKEYINEHKADVKNVTY